MERFLLTSRGWGGSQLHTYGRRETVSKTNENRIGHFARDRPPANACCCIMLASPDLAGVRTADYAENSRREVSVPPSVHC